MTGFEPQTSGIGSDRSTNWATTTSQDGKLLLNHLLSESGQMVIEIEKFIQILLPCGSIWIQPMVNNT